MTSQGCMAMTLKPKTNHPSLKRPEEPRPKKSRQVRSNVKVLLTIVNGVVHPEFLLQRRAVIKEYYLKLWADCAKQFVRNGQNCGKTNHGYCSKITHQLTHRCLCVWNKTVIIPQPPCSPDLASAEFFLFSELKTPIKWKAFCYDWGDKNKIETAAVGNTKKLVSEVFRGLEKRGQDSY